MKTEKDKANSTMQKQVNRLKKHCTNLQVSLENRKKYVRSTTELIQKLLGENRITKEELMLYYKRKKNM